MTHFSALIDAATLKGYLMGTDAPKDVVAMAQQVLDGVMEMLAPRTEGPGIEEYLPIAPKSVTPETPPDCPAIPPAEFPETSVKATDATPDEYERARVNGNGWIRERMRRNSDTTGFGDEVITREEVFEEEAPIAAPETGLTEEIPSPPATHKGAEVENHAPVNHGGGNAKPLKRGAWMPEQKQTLMDMRAAGSRWIDIAAVLGKTGTQCQAMHIKLSARAVKADDGWPEAAKPEKKTAPATPALKQGDGPKMVFTTIKTKNGWGKSCEVEVPLPLSVEKDPDTGATVTKYPPGYARGTFPQRNVGSKGGA